MLGQLLKYQEVDGRLIAIEEAIKSSEEYRKYISARKFLSNVEDTRKAFDERSGALISNYNELKSKFDKLEAERVEFNSIINNCGDDEVEYLSKQAQKLSTQLSAIEGDLKKIFADINDLFAQYKKFVETTKAAKRQFDDNKDKCAALLKDNEAEKAQIEKELSEIAKTIPTAVMEKYKEKRNDKKFPIVLKVNGNYCSGCGTELSIIALSKLKQDKIIECENCRKLIFTDN